MSSEGKDRRNYEDLKAKLGLKKPAAPEPAQGEEPFVRAPAVGEPPGERTPAGGFDLGLERGGAELDEGYVDVEKAAARLAGKGGEALRVKMGPGMRILLAVVLLLCLGAAAGVGWVSADTRAKRLIEAEQTKDAEKILNAVETAVVAPAKEDEAAGPGKLNLVMQEHVDLILQTADKVLTDDVLRTLKETWTTPGARMPDEMLKKVETDLLALRQKCESYVERYPRLDVKAAIDIAVFNGEAVKVLNAYSAVVERLFFASLSYSQEETLLRELELSAPVERLTAQDVKQDWQAVGTMRDPEGRPLAVFLPVSRAADEKGNILYRKKPIEIPAGMKLPEGQPDFRWEVLVRYAPDVSAALGFGPGEREGVECKKTGEREYGRKTEDGKIVKETKPLYECTQHVATDLVGETRLEQWVVPAARKMVEERHHYYQMRTIERLLRGLEDLREAAKPVTGSRDATLAKLRKLAKAE